VPTQRSTRKAPAKRRSSRKSAVGADDGQAIDERLSTVENATKHAELARELVLAAWPGIVQGLIKKAKGGNYQQTRLLLELCELTNTDASQLNEQRREQLCDVLLEGLRLSSAPAQDQGEDGQGSTGTPVEVGGIESHPSCTERD
jgi:hypothetical protein